MKFNADTLRKLEAPNGKSALENFLDWFSAGGVTDAHGQPLVFMHGSSTPESLHEFVPGGKDGSRLSGDAYGVASYFTTSPREASAPTYTRENGAVIPVFVRGKLLDLDAPLSADDSRRLTEFANGILLPSDKARFEMGREVREFADVGDAKDFFDAQKAAFEQFGDGMARAEPEVISNVGGFKIEFTNFEAPISIKTAKDAEILFRAVGWDNLRAAGFDGVLMNRADGTRWAVMHSTNGNIKSALGNNGLYDGLCADITDATSYQVNYDLRMALVAKRHIESYSMGESGRRYAIAP